MASPLPLPPFRSALPTSPERVGAFRSAHIPRVWRVPWAALDFEQDPDSDDGAHAIGVVRVEDGRIVERLHSAIRWPRNALMPSRRTPYVMRHAAPFFADLWPTLAELLDGAQFIAAHNAAYDRRVLDESCLAAGLPTPKIPFVCTVRISRATWNLPSHALDKVCAHLGITLNHHEPLSDAEACAQVLLHARENLPSRPWKSAPDSQQ